MTYRKKTLRQMSPTARKVARLAGEAESVIRRLKNLIPDLQRLDLDSQALFNTKKAQEEEQEPKAEAEVELWHTGKGQEEKAQEQRKES